MDLISKYGKNICHNFVEPYSHVLTHMYMYMYMYIVHVHVS